MEISLKSLAGAMLASPITDDKQHDGKSYYFLKQGNRFGPWFRRAVIAGR